MRYHITASPYATQYGTIEVPDTVPENEVDEYIELHWGDIKFDEPELDYAGTDYEIEKGE